MADDDGLFKQEYEWNRVIDEYQIIRGNFFLCGLGREDFTDIPMDLAEKYAARFWMPESFVNINGQMMVIREDDGTVPHV